MVLLKRFFTIGLLSLLGVKSFAQGSSYVANALQFSQTGVHGTARTLGLAGAQTALGADLASLTSNPAGLGFYRKSEWSINPQFMVPTTTSTDGVGYVKDRKVNFTINNFGAAFCRLRDDIVETKWRGGTFAFGYTRLANFQNTFSYQTNNSASSFADNLVLLANNGYNSSFYDRNNIRTLEDLAFGSYVINPVPIFKGDSVIAYDPTRFINLLPENGEATVLQKETVNSSGSANEWSAGYGGNYNNKVYFGGSFNIVSIYYNQRRQYREFLLTNLNESDIMTSLSFDETLKVRGTGVNLRIGINYVLNDNIRTGISFKSPSIIGINENYEASMSATFKPKNEKELPNSAGKSLIPQTNSYTLYTPSVLNWGVAIFAGKKGFISGEVEYVDYATATLSGKQKINYLDANSSISKNLASVLNFKVGAELRSEYLRFRAGYSYQPVVYQTIVTDLDRRIRSSDSDVISLGLGFRSEQYYLDFAFNRTQFTSNYAPYLMPLKNPTDLKGSEPNISIENRLYTITLGGGVFF